MACNGITHEEKIFVLACDIARAIKEENTDQVRAALYVLCKFVTDGDMEKAMQLGMDHINKCDCQLCRAARAFLKSTPVTQKQTPPDDSFAV